jgi:hypothetical protein
LYFEPKDVPTLLAAVRRALAYVGEDYAPFDGDARAAPRAGAAGQRALAAGGPVRRSLARRYVSGMTPGYDPARNLGGRD